MKLTDTFIRNCKPQTRTRRYFDGRGLYLEVTSAGGKYWRFKYRFDHREKRLSLGVYPDVTLKMARSRLQDARTLVADGIDPSQRRKEENAAKKEANADSFEVIGRDWFKTKSPAWADNHADRINRRLERDIFPWIGRKPIAKITPPEILQALRRIESRGAIETAHRALSNCSQIFRFAISTGRAQSDVCRDLKGALRPVRKSSFAAITEPDEVGALLRIIDGYQGTLVVQCALRLAPLVFVRPGELRKARWKDIELNAKTWRFPLSKTRVDHIVPLSDQAVAILLDLQPLTGGAEYVFPNARSNKRPMSENAVLGAMRRLEIGTDEMCGHGFRAMARTILDEQLMFRVDIIEHQLGHTVRDPLGRAYNRTKHLEERRRMMQAWADYLDQLKNSSKSD